MPTASPRSSLTKARLTTLGRTIGLMIAALILLPSGSNAAGQTVPQSTTHSTEVSKRTYVANAALMIGQPFDADLADAAVHWSDAAVGQSSTAEHPAVQIACIEDVEMGCSCLTLLASTDDCCGSCTTTSFAECSSCLWDHGSANDCKTANDCRCQRRQPDKEILLNVTQAFVAATVPSSATAVETEGPLNVASAESVEHACAQADQIVASVTATEPQPPMLMVTPEVIVQKECDCSADDVATSKPTAFVATSRPAPFIARMSTLLNLTLDAYPNDSPARRQAIETTLTLVAEHAETNLAIKVAGWENEITFNNKDLERRLLQTELESESVAKLKGWLQPLFDNQQQQARELRELAQANRLLVGKLDQLQRNFSKFNAAAAFGKAAPNRLSTRVQKNPHVSTAFHAEGDSIATPKLLAAFEEQRMKSASKTAQPNIPAPPIGRVEKASATMFAAPNEQLSNSRDGQRRANSSQPLVSPAAAEINETRELWERLRVLELELQQKMRDLQNSNRADSSSSTGESYDLPAQQPGNNSQAPNRSQPNSLKPVYSPQTELTPIFSFY